MSDFGSILRSFRTAAGLSQEELAARARLSVQTVSALERGVRRAPYRATIDLIAEALGLDAARVGRLQAAARRRRPAKPGAASDAADFILGALVGRQTDLDALVALSAGPDRLITVVGPGGVGKTRLAQALLAAVGPGTFVSLASIADPALVSALLLHSLGADEREGEDGLARHLAGRPTLVVLDNFEHVLAAAGAVARLLSAAPSLTVVATSRAPLRVRGERVLRLEPLVVPEPAEVRSASDLAGFAATQLFLERARAAGTAAAVDGDDARAIAEIVRRSDGLPLAIELAAAQTRLERPAKLVERFVRGLDLLVDGPRDAPERQQTMRAAISWSYDALAERDRRALGVFALFPAGCTFAAAAAVARMDEAVIVAAARSLFDQSLVVVRGDGEPETRVSMLQPIREFALERLGDDAPALKAAFVGYVADVCERAQARLTGPAQGRVVADINRELDSIRMAFGWAADGGARLDGLRLAGAMWRFWSRRGRIAEGLALCERVLASGTSTASDRETAARANALLAAGMLAQRTGDLARARGHLEESLRLYRRLGDGRGIFGVLNSLGLLARTVGDSAAARTYHGESLAVRRAIGAPRDVAVALNNLGVIALDEGDLDAAQRAFDESFSIAGRDADPWVYALTLHHLGRVAATRGEAVRAKRLFEEALALREELLDVLGIAQTHDALAQNASALGDLRSSLVHYHAAIDHARRVEAWTHVATSLEAAAGVLADADGGAAVSLLAAAATLRRRDRAALDDPVVAALAERLGPQAFGAAWEAGRVLGADTAAETIARRAETYAHGSSGG